MEKICKCGCATKLRKDNSSGFKKGHKPCVQCGALMKSNNIECCSKSCSAKLHWQRNPDMKENRIWNEIRRKSRDKNPNWRPNISKGRKEFLENGGVVWNKGKKGLQVAWNKGRSSGFAGKKHKADYLAKRTATNLERYGIENTNCFTKQNRISKIEKEYGEMFLPNYKSNERIGKYKVDFVDNNTNHIVEIYGDYWHCNPTLFEEDYYHSQLKKTAKEKWEFDNKRKIYLEHLGYTVDTIWGTDAKASIDDYRKKQSGKD